LICKRCHYREVVSGPYIDPNDDPHMAMTYADRRYREHQRQLRRMAAEGKAIPKPNVDEFRLLIAPAALGRLFGLSYESDRELVFASVTDEANEFAQHYSNHVGYELLEGDFHRIWKWLFDAAQHQFNPDTIFGRFFGKVLPKYERAITKLAIQGQWHAPDGILTRRPKPHNHYPMIVYYFFRDQIDIRCGSGIENAYLESRYGLGLAISERLVTDARNWGSADFSDLVNNVGEFTGLYDIHKDWEAFIDKYEPYWPTFEQTLEQQAVA
jgi:hypothetical protein